jgi:hypothetical protein
MCLYLCMYVCMHAYVYKIMIKDAQELYKLYVSRDGILGKFY